MILLERLSYDLEKVFAVFFTDQCLARLKQLLHIPAKETPNMGSNYSSISQAHYCISNDVKAKCQSLSRKFHGEMTLFASAFAKPMKIHDVCFCSISQLNVLQFIF